MSYVAMTRCYYCGEPSTILLDRYLRDISEMQNIVVDMTPCSKCAILMEEGIMLLEIDESRSTPGWNIPKKENSNWMPSPYRTGRMIVIKEDTARRVISDAGILEYMFQYRWMFIDAEALKRLEV